MDYQPCGVNPMLTLGGPNTKNDINPQPCK